MTTYRHTITLDDSEHVALSHHQRQVNAVFMAAALAPDLE